MHGGGLRGKRRYLAGVLVPLLAPGIVAAVLGSILPHGTFQLSLDRQYIVAQQKDGRATILLRADALPAESSLAPGLFYNTQRFRGFALSPDELVIAFSTVGHHAMVGLCTLSTKAIQELAMVYEGDAGDLHWSPNSRFLAYEILPASGYHQLRVYDLKQRKHLALGINRLENPVDTSFVRWACGGGQLIFVVHEVGTGRWVTKQLELPTGN